MPYIEVPAQLSQCARGAHQDHVRPGHLGEAQAAGRQDQVQEVRAARYRAARGDHSHRRRRRRHRHADSRGRRADSARQDGPVASAISSACRSASSKPYGLFFVCGPTGSGKTTTLHSVLGHLNTPDTKIWTAEDPVEITQKGLRQVQVNTKAGLDFRGRHEVVPARRSRHHHGRRDARQGNRLDRHRGLAYRPSGVRHPAYEQRARIDHPPARHGHGPVQLRRRAARHPRAAPGEAPVRMQGGLHAATQDEIELLLERVLRRSS